MTDSELLGLAAKAAGYESQGMEDGRMYLFGIQDGWNPLKDDGDALRLAVTLNIDLMNATDSEDGSEGQSVTFPIRGDFDGLTEWHDTASEKQAATRRAIVRAAAEIARQTAAA